MLEEIEREVGGFLFFRALFVAIPGADEGQGGQLHVVLLQGVLEADGVAEVAQPVAATTEGAFGDLEDHGLNAGEACFGGHLDHVVQLVVIALAGALHEPGVHLGAEFDFCHRGWDGFGRLLGLLTCLLSGRRRGAEVCRSEYAGKNGLFLPGARHWKRQAERCPALNGKIGWFGGRKGEFGVGRDAAWGGSSPGRGATGEVGRGAARQGGTGRVPTMGRRVPYHRGEWPLLS